MILPKSEIKSKKLTGRQVLDLGLVREITPKVIQTFGEKTLGLIEKGRISTLETNPAFKTESEKVKNEFRVLEAFKKGIDKDINKFNIKFGDKTLNDIQFKLASSEEERINNKIINFQRLISTTEKKQFQRLQDKDRNFVLAVAGGVTTGIVQAPFNFASLVVGGVTKPATTLLEVRVGAEELAKKVGKEGLIAFKDIKAGRRVVNISPSKVAEFSADLVVESILLTAGTGLLKRGAGKAKNFGKNIDFKKFDKALNDPDTFKLSLFKNKKGQVRFAALEEVVTGKKKKKKKKSLEEKEIDLDRVADELIYKFNEKTKRTEAKTNFEKLEDINKIFEGIAKEKNPSKRKKQGESITKYLERVHGKQQFQLLFKDLLAQKGFNVNIFTQPVKGKPKPFPTPKPSVEVFKINPPNLVNKLPEVKATVKVKTTQILKTQQQLRFKESSILEQQSKSKQAITNLQLQKSKQNQQLSQKQAFDLLTKQTSAQKSAQKQFSALKLKTGTTTATPSLKIQALKQITQLKKKQRLTKLKKPIPFKLPKGVKQTDLIKAIQKLGKKNAVNIIVGMKIGKRKTIGKNLPPFKAMKKAQRFVDKNIQASYLLKPTGKKSKQKDLKPFNASFKFRPSKVNPLFQVERKRFRLDSPTEVKQLKDFRGKVSKSFFGKPKKRKK